MDRLTHKKYSTTDCDNVMRVLKNGTTDKFVVGGRAITKLAEFEDFMEQNGFESLEDLKHKIDSWVDEKRVREIMSENLTPYIKENVQLKIRWQKLKEWVVKEQGYASMFQEERIQALDDVKDKMEELEKE